MKIRNQQQQLDTFIIAELSANHNNKLEVALKTVREMAKAGANAVKVQTFRPESMTLNLNNDLFKTRTDSAWAGQKLFDLYQKGALPYDWHTTIQKQAHDVGLEFFSSPFDEEAVDFLEKMKVPRYKVASLEINHTPLLKYIAKQGKPMILSTGVSRLSDIDHALETITTEGNNDISLLKCTTAYPTLPEESELSHIKWLKEHYQLTVGLSDHSMSKHIPSIAVALGATIIEKHFILDRKMGGIDSHFSLEPSEFKAMVDLVRETEKSLGGFAYQLHPKGISARKSMRSIIVTKKINKGELLSRENIAVLRPGNGLHPMNYDEIIGKKVLYDLEIGTPLQFQMILK